jgi:hypothetical protein
MRTTRRFRTLPRPATIVAIVALVLACAGSAVAGAQMVSGRQVVDGSLTGRDLRNGSVQRTDLAAGARMPVTTTREAHAFGTTAQVRCATGEVAVGGGGSVHAMDESKPILDDQGVAVGWVVSGTADDGTPDGAAAGDGPVAHADTAAQAYVICQHG